MATQVENNVCKLCGWPISIGANECPAGHPVHITTFNSVKDMPAPMINKYVRCYEQDLADDPDDVGSNFSIGICYLKLKLYDKALAAFEKAIEDNFDNSEVYFYAAACLLRGKKAFLQQRAEINKILEYLNAAIMIEPTKGIYHYFVSYIKYDYFSRKFLNISPNYSDELATAKSVGLPEGDVSQFWDILGLPRPEVL